mmetsp:Transcript_27811/g.67631  ORF Transcript_27811/g.67631 Transcript_27811/m.67631 type:complete len:230 (-) Transcript_27811:272-961(-)
MIPVVVSRRSVKLFGIPREREHIVCSPYPILHRRKKRLGLRRYSQQSSWSRYTRFTASIDRILSSSTGSSVGGNDLSEMMLLGGPRGCTLLLSIPRARAIRYAAFSTPNRFWIRRALVSAIADTGASGFSFSSAITFRPSLPISPGTLRIGTCASRLFFLGPSVTTVMPIGLWIPLTRRARSLFGPTPIDRLKPPVLLLTLSAISEARIAAISHRSPPDSLITRSPFSS